jgi:hypothetical protein
MCQLTLQEAQLFRVLTSFFGRERVVPRMSVLCVCGGCLPEQLEVQRFGLSRVELELWARSNTCLFTIIDDEGDPHLVIEFCSDFAETVDLEELEHSRYLKGLLAPLSIAYVTMTPAEFAELLTPGSGLDIVSLLRDKFS